MCVRVWCVCTLSLPIHTACSRVNDAIRTASFGGVRWGRLEQGGFAVWLSGGTRGVLLLCVTAVFGVWPREISKIGSVGTYLPKGGKSSGSRDGSKTGQDLVCLHHRKFVSLATSPYLVCNAARFAIKKL